MFKPSEKQDTAIWNMEKVLWYEEHQHETIFKDSKTFQKYFEELQEQVSNKMKKDKKRKNFRKAVENKVIDLEKIKERRKEKILAYYNNEKVLKEKWLVYQAKYGTSINKMKEWMLNKSKNKELVEKIISETKVNEWYLIFNRIGIMLNQWKSVQDIKSKLIYQKKFNKDLVESILEEEYGDYEYPEELIKNIIDKYQRKKKNKNYISFELSRLWIESKYINWYMDKYYNIKVEENNLKREYHKLVWKYEKQIIIQKLMRKGFSYNEINKLFPQKKEW